MGRIIEVVPHDATAWRAAFAREARALKHVFGEAVIAIHHVGSTSIPGLPAKPIIDLLVVLRETVTIGRFSSAMEALGYRVRGEVPRCGGSRYTWALLLQQGPRREADASYSRVCGRPRRNRRQACVS